MVVKFIVWYPNRERKSSHRRNVKCEDGSIVLVVYE